MLSLSNVGCGVAAANYYESSDNYYISDVGSSSWWGIGAARLNLHGEVLPAEFSDLLSGRLTNGASLHRGGAGRRGATDGTFSAPKSVSLQALVGGDKRIIDAHCLSVDRALNHAETLAACRITDDGMTHSEPTGNLVVARFIHDLSRACDPQLHTHCVMLNATQRADGQWRASDNQSIYRQKMLLGALYRSELARELQNLGYQVRQTHFDGRFELDHINDAQVRAFSQRSASIEAYLRSHKGLERSEATAWDKKIVAVVTREKKTNVDRSHLYQEWVELSKTHEIDYSVPAQPFNLEVKLTASEILNQAVSHISERKSVFSHQGIVQAALERGVGVATMDEIEGAINESIRFGRLIREGELYTTAEAQQLEREILNIEIKGRSTFTPIYQGEPNVILPLLSGLSAGQRDAALGILLTSNQIIGIQGRAGAGKTTLLKIASAQAKACGYSVMGLAPSASAARELAATGIETETITAFSHRSGKNLDSRTLLIVDESGMTSTHQMHKILSEAAMAGCRVVLVGDTSQLNSVEAGKPFSQLQQNGMHTADVSQIQRQKNPILKSAVEFVVNGKVAMAVQVLDKNTIEIFDSSERFDRIAHDYCALSEIERHATKVIAGTRYARGEINQNIRIKLGLLESGQEFVLLDRKDHTVPQARSILSYDSGDLVLAEADFPSLGLKRGDLASVVQRLDNCILLENASGERVRWQPALATKLSAYVPVKRSLSAGDLVRVTANDRLRGLINGEIARVSSISGLGQSVLLKFDDGRTVSLDGRRPMALDYGYCSTVYSSQGLTCDRVLIEADAHSLTANVNTFYVAISRARFHAQIYTDDHEMLPFAMGRQIENLSALDIQRQEAGLVKTGDFSSYEIA